MPTREEMKGLAEEIVGTYADRMATIGELRETVKLNLLESQRHLQDLRNSRMAMGKEMRADLAKDSANRQREVGDMLYGFGQALAVMGKETRIMGKEMRADLAEDSANRKQEVGNMLDGFGQALAVMGKETRIMGKEMRAGLAKDSANRQHEVGNMLRSFSAELREIRSELAGGRDEWHKMTATLQSKRGGAAVAVKPPAKKAVGKAPEAATLRNQVFQYLANHPDGTKLVELEKEFGLARVKITRVLKDLMDEGEVKKRNLHYFAI
jgi:hypothetical protein